MKNEFGTQCAAAMTVAIAITKNPLFSPEKEETCSDEKRYFVLSYQWLDIMILLKRYSLG